MLYVFEAVILGDIWIFCRAWVYVFAAYILECKRFFFFVLFVHNNCNVVCGRVDLRFLLMICLENFHLYTS
jgi:hypothetical protein